MDASERKEMLSVNGGRFEMNQMIFPDNAALVVDSEKLCRLLSEFGRVCKRIKFTGILGKSKLSGARGMEMFECMRD